MAGGLGLLAKGLPLFGQGEDEEQSGSYISKGDAALLRFAAAAEIIEADFWAQYNELGGVRDSEVPGGVEIQSTLLNLKTSTATFPNTSMTTLTMRSATTHSSTLTWCRRARRQSIWTSSVLCPVVRRPAQAESRGLQT
jgi:hypothetical protein